MATEPKYPTRSWERLNQLYSGEERENVDKEDTYFEIGALMENIILDGGMANLIMSFSSSDSWLFLGNMTSLILDSLKNNKNYFEVRIWVFSVIESLTTQNEAVYVNLLTILHLLDMNDYLVWKNRNLPEYVGDFMLSSLKNSSLAAAASTGLISGLAETGFLNHVFNPSQLSTLSKNLKDLSICEKEEIQINLSHLNRFLSF